MQIEETTYRSEPVISVLSNEGQQINVYKVDLKDAWGICDFVVANESRLTAFFPQTKAANLTPDLSKRFVELKTKEFDARQEFLYTLKVVGSRNIIGLVYIKELNWDKLQGELAYSIDYAYEGKGIISKIVNSLSEYAFKTLELKTLQIIVHKSNLASVRVAEKCGFVWQKTLIKSFNPTGKHAIDMELYERYK